MQKRGKRLTTGAFTALLALCLSWSSASHAADDAAADDQKPDDTEALAKKAQNPIANLISLPFQNNTTFDYGPRHRTQNVLNIQPVLPFTLNEDWNLITRWILPIIHQPSLARGDSSDNGTGNLNPSLFCRPRSPRISSSLSARRFCCRPRRATSSARKVGRRSWPSSSGRRAIGSSARWPTTSGPLLVRTTTRRR